MTAVHKVSVLREGRKKTPTNCHNTACLIMVRTEVRHATFRFRSRDAGAEPKWVGSKGPSNLDVRGGDARAAREFRAPRRRSCDRARSLYRREHPSACVWHTEFGHLGRNRRK